MAYNERGCAEYRICPADGERGAAMKPRVKNDSWCYTVSTSTAGRKVKRLKQKRHRRDDKAIIKENY